MILRFKLFFYIIVGSLVSLFNISRIKRKLKLKHDLFNLTFDNNDQLVILGTSDSINNISSKEWNEINKATTVGVNYFLFNDFIPDVIQFEVKEVKIKYYFENLLKIIIARQLEYKDTYILIKSNFGLSRKDLDITIDFLKQIPEGLKKNLRFCVDFPIPAITKKELKIALKLMNSLKIFDLKNMKFTPHLRASIGLTSVWAIKYGFREVIFGGVDLNHNRIFYNKEDLYAKYKIIIDSPRSAETHKTNNPDFSEITIVEALNLLKKEIGSKVSFSVISDKSALRKIMPLKFF